jgi:hypothetical protein
MIDEDGASAEIDRLAALSQSRKPLYSDRFLSKRTPGTEHLGAPPDAQLSHDDLLAAQKELAELHGVSSARVRGMVMLAHAQAGLGYSETEQADVIREVALSLERGEDAVSGGQILELSGRAGGDTIGLAADLDLEHLQAAAVLARSGHDGWKDAGELIAERAGELGVPDPLGSGAVRASADTMALAISMAAGDELAPGTAEDAEVARLTADNPEMFGLAARGAGGSDSAAAVISRHPELAHLFRTSPRTSSRRHPSKAGRMVGTGSRAHASDLDESKQDTRQPAKGGEVHADVKRLIEANPDLFAPDHGREGEGTGNRSYAPKSAAQREREERRAQAGHGAGQFSIEQLAAGSARSASGR